MTSSLLPWTLQSLLSELYYNNAPLPVPRRAVEPIITSMLQSPKTSLRLANKTLDKTPSALVKCLKACALNATGKSSEGKSVTKQVLGDPKGMGEAGCILLLTHLVELFKLHREFPTAAEAALTAHSDRKDVCLAVMGIFLRLGDFKKVQQISLRMYKTFQSQADPSKPDQRWLQAAVQAMLMQCRQIKDPQASERSLLLAMVDRNLQSLPPPQTVDEFHLHSQFFGLKGSQAEVEWFKRDDVKKIASQDLGTELKRREVLAAHGSKEDQLSLAEECLSKIDDKNWATISMVISLAMRLENQELLGRTLAKLTELADHPELGKERGYAMGLLLPHQLVKEDPVKSSLKLPGDPLDLIVNFYDRFSSKYSTWTDLEAFLPLLQPDQLNDLSERLQPGSAQNAKDLQSRINKERILLSFRHIHQLGQESDKWLAQAGGYVEAYFTSLPLGKGLPSTDLQFADEYAMLASECWLHAWKQTGDSTHLMSCACLLDYAIKRSSYRFQIRLLLIRVYKLLGLPLRALDQWKALGAKQIQIDTLAHYGMDRSYFWSLVTTDSSQHANGRLEAPSPFLEQLTRMDGWYSLGLSETSDSIFKVWTKGIWQKVAEYHELYDRLSNSLTQANLRLNRTMVAGAMPTVQESIGRDQLLDSLEALQPVSHWSDNRDDSLLPLSVRELSEVGPKSNATWLEAMVVTRKVALKLNDPASSVDILPDALEEQLKMASQICTSAEQDWIALVGACSQIRNTISETPANETIASCMSRRLHELQKLSKCDAWSWKALHEASSAAHNLVFLQGFIDASARAKAIHQDTVKSLKKVMSGSIKTDVQSISQHLAQLPQQVPKDLETAPLSKQSSLDWSEFIKAATDEWSAACKESSLRLKKLA